MSERMGTLRNVVRGPRWAAFPIYLRNLAYMLRLKITLDIDKGFIRETVRFEVEGDESKIDQFSRQLESDMEQYNN